MNTEMDGGTTYEDDLRPPMTLLVPSTAAFVEADPIVFWQYRSYEQDKDEKITHLVCADCLGYVCVKLEREAPIVPLLGCLESGFPYDYVEGEVEFHPELEHLSMEDGGKWLYYSELEREYLICSECNEVFLTYWPETRKMTA